METLIIIGLLIGLAAGISLTALFYKNKSNQKLHSQSVLLLEKIKQVCKLITVEGEFSELYTHHGEKSIFFNLLQMHKKALVIIKAKVLIGFDLTKLSIETNTREKQVRLSNFPPPEIMSIDTNLEYYDIQKGMIGKFSENDLTSINKKTKEFIREKVKESDLFAIANNQANETILVIKQLIESVGWVLVFEGSLPSANQKIIEN